MPSRHRSRSRALQILFECDVRGGDVDQAITHYYQTLYSEESETQLEPDAFMEELVRGTVAKRDDIDRVIESKSANWRLNRMAVVDRNILRLAIFEMGLSTLPSPVVIDEALQLARQFSGDESLAFINGVLDAVNKQSTASAS